MHARIGQQICQHLVQTRRVADQRYGLVREVELPFVVGSSYPSVGNAIDRQHSQVQFLLPQRSAGIQARQQQQVLDKSGHPGRFGLDTVQRVCHGMRLVLPATSEFGISADGGQRCAKFMGGIGHELSNPGLGGRRAVRALET